ncbi:hypothetical protein KCU83_g300, partial [Aureobasidium melanogenum]
MSSTGPYHMQVSCHGFMITPSRQTDGARKYSEQFRFDLLVMAGLAPRWIIHHGVIKVRTLDPHWRPSPHCCFSLPLVITTVMAQFLRGRRRSRSKSFHCRQWPLGL